MDPLISVIIPVYRVAPYVRRCVRTLCSQSYSNYELIFVDDASPDESCSVLEDELSRHPAIANKTKIVHHKENRGLGAARNTGMGVAHGEWCVFVDSDDYVSSDFLKNLMPSASKKGDVAVAGFCYESDGSTSTGYRRIVFEPQEIDLGRLQVREFTIAIMYSLACGRLYDLELIRRHGLRFESITPHEDTLFFMRYLTVANRIVFRDSCDYHYIQYNANSLTKKTRSPKEYLMISGFLLKAWEDLFSRLPHVKPADVRSCIQRYGLSQMLQAIRSQYLFTDTSRDRRLANLEVVRNRRKLFARYYKPSCILYGLFEKSVLYLPRTVLDFVLSSISFVKKFAMRNVL